MLRYEPSVAKQQAKYNIVQSLTNPVKLVQTLIPVISIIGNRTGIMTHMSHLTIPLIERNPTDKETTMLMLAMSTFCDGTGQEREKDGSTRPGWRDFERVFAETLRGFAPENKDIFDVVVPAGVNSNNYYGLSLKSKQLSRAGAIGDLEDGGRVHMELANSPAKFWEALFEKGIREADFTNMKQADIMGETVLQVVDDWHKEAKAKYELTNHNKKLDLGKSVYITVSYSKPIPGTGRHYQVHSFNLKFPKNIIWKYISPRCLRGYDPQYENEAVFDWYGLSGGQLKYYPRAKDSLFKTRPFVLLKPENVSILEKAETYWPEIWLKAA